MQRESDLKIFLRGAGFMLFGNILGGIMTISIAPFLDQWFIPYIAVLFTVFIYVSLMFTAGWKDGEKEAKMLRNHRVESIPKKRWIIFGLILAAVMCIICSVLLACSLGAFTFTGEILLGSYFAFGAFAPSFFIAGIAGQNSDTAALTPVFPLVLMALYLIITPIAAHLGYRFGINEKNFKDLMYEKDK